VAFNEDSRVKIPALIHLERLGYKYLSLKSQEWDPNTNVFTRILDDSLKRINPKALPEDLEIFKKRTLGTLENEDLGLAFYEALRFQGGLRLIDFTNFENNTFNCVTELEFQNGLDAFRPDITVLVNGLPLVFIEVKKPNNKEGVLAERNRINSRFANRNFRRIINLTQFMIFSNNMEYDAENLSPIQGAFYATTSMGPVSFNCFREEELEFDNPNLISHSPDEDYILSDTNLVSIKHSPEFAVNKNPNTPTNRILSSMISMERLGFLLNYGITYVKTFKGIEKHIMRYPQLFATLAINKGISHGQKKGIIWHTQGSGKTALAYYNTRYLTDFFQQQNKVAKFYFIVDRLDLLTQAQSEFSARGLRVNSVNSKAEFLDDFSRNQATSNQSGELEITVVNIQKFSEDASEHFSQDYDLNIQRVFFIDEAHRSYRQNGSFLANLISSDRDALMICLTGTPIIGEFASKKIFGDYFHKYYYNASIADGYTLRLIREGIESTYAAMVSEVLTKFEVQKGKLDKSTVLAHGNFVSPMLDYIVSDLRRSRMLHDDQTIGGMVVCDSSEQAREMFLQFNQRIRVQQNLSSSLILYDEGTKDERTDQVEKFKEGKTDLLFVYNMLLTGFDAPRLKKLYMGRVVRDHNLLQALTRVNRPYKKLRYGYIVDFADIRSEFEVTNAAYSAELMDELGDEFGRFSNLFLTRDEIISSVEKIKHDLFLYDLKNSEIFSRQVSEIQDKKIVRSIVASLESSRDLFNVIRTLNLEDLASLLDFERLNILLREASNHLDLINLKEKLENADETKMLLNSALEDVLFMFHKTGEAELQIAALKGKTREVREALDRNIDEQDPQFLVLIEELRRVLRKGNITESVELNTETNLGVLTDLIARAQKLNQENSLIASRYGNDSKFVRVHKALRLSNPRLSDANIHSLLDPVRSEINLLLLSNSSVLENQSYFEAIIERSLAVNLQDGQFAHEILDLEKLKFLVAREYYKELERVVA
jgi:type I restriction enzyme R subunit